MLHGPYKRFVQGGTVLEQGIYYKGLKHGRWVKYNKDSVLLDKEKYIKGWPKESQVTYYDPFERKKLKEITPIEYGEREGYYYLFHDNGKPAVVGEYKFNKKINDWIEYYPDGKRKKLFHILKNLLMQLHQPMCGSSGMKKVKKFIEGRNNAFIGSKTSATSGK